MARLSVWQPFGDMLAFDAAMENMLGNQQRAQSAGRAGHSGGFPMNLAENSEGYTLTAVLPGVHPDDLTIDFVDGVLTIKATRKAPEASEGQSYHLRELADAQYERSLRFPVQINAEAISASYEHGVLTLSLPKAEEVKPRRINVQAAS